MTRPKGLQRVRAVQVFRHAGAIVPVGAALLLRAEEAAPLLRQGLVEECRTDEGALLRRFPNAARKVARGEGRRP